MPREVAAIVKHQDSANDDGADADEAVMQAVASDVDPAAFVVDAQHGLPPNT